ncbi:hypothetical protein BRADI_3g04256v3 [Brachypodium distachyon]|uniref:Uncharacterized protein n=1 Tax=Brachypodium distachyon TaxID=15368 RepID=A0A2K2CV52_BRADI|nr:hypothetical protein BRADI_3g04256v3 [Brachypodium distachyon]
MTNSRKFHASYVVDSADESSMGMGMNVSWGYPYDRSLPNGSPRPGSRMQVPRRWPPPAHPVQMNDQLCNSMLTFGAQST